MDLGDAGRWGMLGLSKMGKGLVASLLLLFLSLLHGADITVETDMLLSLLQSPVADPESEALARKVSCKLSLPRPGEVSVCVVVGCSGGLRGSPGMPAWVCPSQGPQLRQQLGAESQPTLRATPGSPPGTASPNLHSGGCDSEPLRRTHHCLHMWD